ncbi:MAG TPA: hypothetical protein VFG04_15350 [Planctomycetaceae bacterium]|jgi:hypothetical protein|nr:hypothetical protein [Planctomycetaceae bacterium]
MTNAADMIDRIVAGVLEQLQAPAVAAAPASRSTAAANGSLVMDDSVITAALLETRGVVAGPVVFAPKAILTPSAIDFLSSRKIKWTRANKAPAAQTTIATWSVFVSRSTPALESALGAVARQPGVQWQRELVGCHREAARRAVGALCRGESDGVITFTSKPEALACHANRSAQVRAAAVQTGDGIKRIKRTLGANLFAVDPGEQSVFALQNLLREMVAGGKPAVPADWSE